MLFSLEETQVIDRTKLVFKVTSATANANGSLFTAPDAGGAETDIGNNNRNRLNVTADRLAFSVQTANTSVGTNMIDLDLSGNINLTSTGTPTTQPIGTISNGQTLFNTVIHTVVGGPFNLTASYAGWNVTSSPFFISNVINGSYRTTSD